MGKEDLQKALRNYYSSELLSLSPATKAWPTAPSALLGAVTEFFENHGRNSKNS